jgi:hypothetical protein
MHATYSAHRIFLDLIIPVKDGEAKYVKTTQADLTSTYGIPRILKICLIIQI